MNPSSTQTANITATYYAGGKVVNSKTLQVNPLMRGTTSPHDLGINQQVAIKVTSDVGVVVERPLYFKDSDSSTLSNVGSSVTGAASAVGATALGNDWLFAEGFTGKNFQEYLVLANFTNTDTTATVTLEYSNGSQQSVPVTVPALSQIYFDVNYYGAHPIVGGLVTTGDVSAEVTTPTASIVAERLMYFIFRGLPGGTDAVGEAGPSSHSVYAFAEGFTHGSFSEFLTLQNPNTTDEDAVVTLFANSSIIQRTVHLPKQSRTTVDVNSLVVPMAQAYAPNKYEVSLDVQALNGTIVAERPMYFNYNGSTGATDVFGYTGN